MPRYNDLPPTNVPDPRKAKKPEARKAGVKLPRLNIQLPTLKSSGPGPKGPGQKGRGPKGPGRDSGDFDRETTVSRRGFTIVAASAAAITGGIAFIISRLGLGKHKDEDPASAPVVVDSGDATNIIESYEEVDTIRLVERASFDLPLGSVLSSAEGVWLPVVMPGERANAVTCASALNIQTGDNPVVVPSALTNNPNALVLDVRCSDTVFAWSEINISDRSWSLYASSWLGGKLTGDTSTLWQADNNWDPPYFCCTGDQVIWQVQPSLSGNKTTEGSELYRWRTGDASASRIMESPGRFAGEPTVSADAITVIPRVTGESSSSAYYGITALSKTDPTHVIDQLVMPASVKPFRAVRTGDQFAFSVEATYGSGGLLSNMGYYLGTSTGHITWLSREPAAGVWGRDGAYVFKSRASYLVVDQTEEQFGVLLASDRSVDYGEYPAASGDTDTFVTFATVKDADTGLPGRVVVRTFDLISSAEAKRIKEQKEREEAERAAAAAEAEAAAAEESEEESEA